MPRGSGKRWRYHVLGTVPFRVAATADATRDAAPDLWRRHLTLLLDGLRPGAAHALARPTPFLSRR